MWFCVIVETSSPLVSSFSSIYSVFGYFLCGCVIVVISLFAEIIVILFLSSLRALYSWLLLHLCLATPSMTSSLASVEKTCAKAFLVTFGKSSKERGS